MTFCHNPWTNLEVTPKGVMQPCCKFRNEAYDDKPLTIANNSISQYLQSTVLQQVKQDFNAGNWPKGCESCRLEENNGMSSKRTMDYTRWQKEYDAYNFESNEFLIGALAFGNTCNIKCITCRPGSSSRWVKEYKDIYNIHVEPYRFNEDQFVNDFFDHSPNIIHMDIGGGEPLLSGAPQQRRLLSEYVSTGQSKNIVIHYNTNGTIFPDDEWWKLWDNFKQVEMQISLDGVGPKFEYIRYLAKWDEVVKNVRKYQIHSIRRPNFKISISHTLSAYNIYYLDEFFDWCDSYHLPEPWVGIVHKPEHMSPAVWTGPARQAIIDHLQSSKRQSVRTWSNYIINHDETAHYREFIKKLVEHDRYRGLNFKTTFPEMAQYLNENSNNNY